MHLIRGLNLAIFLGLSFLAQPHFAAEDNLIPEKSPAIKNHFSEVNASRFNDPLRGIVVNRTVTVQGHEFYRYFAMWWRHHPDASHYSISVYERPSARWGSEIWIEHHNNRIFHMFLPPARSRTKDISREAAAYSLQRIEENELEKSLSQNIDLAPEEM